VAVIKLRCHNACGVICCYHALRYGVIYNDMSLCCLYNLLTGVSPTDPMTAQPNDHKGY
jgi:hypothetical protein